jgi:hypothetical protein
METEIAKLKSELAAIALWDRLFADLERPEEIDKDACAARFRRLQVIEEKLKELHANEPGTIPRTSHR